MMNGPLTAPAAHMLYSTYVGQVEGGAEGLKNMAEGVATGNLAQLGDGVTDVMMGKKSIALQGIDAVLNIRHDLDKLSTNAAKGGTGNAPHFSGIDREFLRSIN